MTTTSRQTHVEQVLVEVTSLLMERAKAELERAVASAESDEGTASQLRRLQELDKHLRALRHDLGLTESSGAVEAHQPRQVSRFYEVPGQEDA